MAVANVPPGMAAAMSRAKAERDAMNSVDPVERWNNPVYRHIAYVREIVLAGTVPSLGTHLALLGFAVAAFLAGAFMYKRYNTTFLYYV